ncbi:hypothetical protein D3C86_2153430 [compost metagenome]
MKQPASGRRAVIKLALPANSIAQKRNSLGMLQTGRLAMLNEHIHTLHLLMCKQVFDASGILPGIGVPERRPGR